MANSTYSKVDEYGFERPENFDYKTYDEFMSRYIRTLTRRSQRWETLKERNKFIKSTKLRRFVRKGIPMNLRPSVWMAISGGQKLKNDSLLTYSELKRKVRKSSATDTIVIDLPRTFPDNIYFTNHEHLTRQMYHVLATFAHQNSEVGYCQGLNYITGLLLLATKNEETSYWLLKVLVEDILPKYSVRNMSGLLIDFEVLDVLVKKYEPAVHTHVHKLGMPWAMVTTKWFICLFAEVLPTETVFRIWDCLFYEGSKIIFQIGLTLIKIHRNSILETKELSELITCFKSMSIHKSVIDCHQFMFDIHKHFGQLRDNDINKLRTKFESTVTKN